MMVGENVTLIDTNDETSSTIKDRVKKKRSNKLYITQLISGYKKRFYYVSLTFTSAHAHTHTHTHTHISVIYIIGNPR